ncbi:hypothetical protein BAE44_0019099, partial [Dichanthelium oligosanthes]
LKQSQKSQHYRSSEKPGWQITFQFQLAESKDTLQSSGLMIGGKIVYSQDPGHRLVRSTGVKKKKWVQCKSQVFQPNLSLSSSKTDAPD